ncbi:MAG: PAS domain S-box protein [Bacteroidota bacterium]|nr:PAS domain S-box protein [Bacteroidota bacterium]
MEKKEFISKIVDDIPVGVLTFNKDYIITFINDTFNNIASYYNIDIQEFLGQSILNRKMFSSNLKIELDSLKSGSRFAKEIKDYNVPGHGSISILIKGSPLFEDSTFSGGVLTLEDYKVLNDSKESNSIKLSHYEYALSKSFDLFVITDIDGHIKFASGRNIKPVSLSNLQNKHISKILNISSNKSFSDSLYEIKTKKKTITLQLESFFEEKHSVYRTILQPILNPDKTVLSIFFFFYDITDIAVQDDKLKKEIQGYKKLYGVFEEFQDALFTLDLKGNITFWNNAAENLFNYSKDKVNGKFLGEVLEFYDAAYLEKIKKELYSNNKWESIIPIFKGLHKNLINAKFYLYNKEGFEVIIVFCTDITEKIEQELELKRSEEKYRNIITEASELICNLKVDGTIIYVNPAFQTTLGYGEKALLNRNIKDIIEPNFLSEEGFDLSIFNESNKYLDVPLLTQSGDVAYFLAKFSPIVVGKNTVSYYNGFLTDITTKKMTEQDLELFKSLFEASQDGIIVLKDQRVLLVNNAFSNLFGYNQKSELYGKDFLDLVESGDKEKAYNAINKISEDPNEAPSFEFVGIQMNGRQFYGSASLASFKKKDELFVVIIVRDITERKRSQEALKDSEEKYRGITENIDDFLYTFERSSASIRPVFCTASVETITGYTQDEFLSNSKLFLKIIHPDDFSEVKQKLKHLIKSKIQLSEELEFRIVSKHGNVNFVRNKINIHRRSDGVIQRIFGLVSDITLRKKAEEELKSTTENLMKLNNTKDKFLSIVSHDLRTPFTSILGFTDLLLTDEELTGDEKRQYIGFIQDSAKSMLSLVNSLLDWTRLQTGRIKFEPEKVRINTIIEDSINSMQGAAFQKKIKLHSLLDEKLYVFVDRNLILQVFNNLISNAIKFTNSGGKITISAAPSKRTRFYEFCVQDTGIGISNENLDNLFKVDTKYTSEGTAGERGSGLGLSLVKEIIEKHGGNIWVNSKEGEGSEFTFTLPINSPNILVIEDNKTDSLLYKKILGNIAPDYIVDIATTADEAYNKIIEAIPAMIISGHILYDSTGYELILKLQRSELKQLPPIIILTSEKDYSVSEDYKTLGVEYVFKKPVILNNFKKAVEKTLRKRF